VSTLHRNAGEPLSSVAGLPHVEQIHEGAAAYSELPADCDDVSLAEKKGNSPVGQVTEQRLPVNFSGTRLAADTEESFLKLHRTQKTAIQFSWYRPS
jgi:hypothetical protein